MKHYDLVFQIPAEVDIYFVSQYLPAEASGYILAFKKKLFDSANIRIESDHYLMSLAMMKVFSRYGQFVVGEEKDRYWFWKEGIIVDKGDNLLLIKFDRKAQSIELFPDKQHTNFDLQHELVDFILNIPVKSEKGRIQKENSEEENFKFKRHDINWSSSFFDVWVSLDGSYFVNWAELLAQIGKEIYQIESIASIENEVTRTIETKKKTVPVVSYKRFLPENKMDKAIKIFVSYAHADNKKGLVDLFVEELEGHLKAIEGDYKFDIFKDEQILMGQDWHERLQNEVRDANLAILLLSSSFLKSEYINNNELAIFLEKNHQEKNNLVCPVYFDPFQFRGYEFLKKYQFFKPKRKVFDPSYEHLGDDLCYGDLVEFDPQSGLPQPNRSRSRYMVDFVDELAEALKKKKG